MISMVTSLAKTMYSVLFRPNSFHCQLSIGRNLEFQVYECPGRWCTDEQLKKIHDDMITVAIASQQGKGIPEYGALAGSREDMRNRIISIAYDKKTGEAVGFSAQSYLEVTALRRVSQVLHLGLIFVDPRMRGRNLTGLLSILPNIVIFLKTGMRPVWVSNVSQVPAIIGLVGDNFSNVYPVPSPDVQQTFEHRWLASQLVEKHRQVFGVGYDAEYDMEKQIIRNAYTGGSDNLKKTFAEAPKYRKTAYNDMCEQNLDYDRGDDFVQLGRMDLGCYVNFAHKKVHGRSRATMMVNLLFMGLAGFVVPVFRWLVPA